MRRTGLLLAAAAALVASCRKDRGAPPPAGAERVLALDGAAGRLKVSDGGSGEPAVVFVHGLGGDLEAWRAQLDHLRPSRRAVAYDQRGHGGSEPARDGAYTIEALADDLEAVRRGLGLGRMVLVGHSLAGTVLTAYARAHPERVAGLVYVDAVGDFAAIPPEHLRPLIDREASPSFDRAAQRAAFEELLGPRARPRTRERVLASLGALDPKAFAALRRSMFGFSARGDPPAPGAPALAVEADGPVLPIMACAVLRLPRVALPDVSHWLQLDDPEGLDRALDAFLASAR
ncbi:MAG TPA: alpha/beta hydrolase [Anaeromyxobacteraceae bacterium]|nr:alpha/beta hydrolase [Anaeromyxobacteraceae bacterium]